MKELKAVEILRERLKELWDTRPLWFGDSEAHHNKIFAVEDAIKELRELTQEKSCEGCELEDYIKPNFTPNGCAKCKRNPNSKLKDRYTPKEQQ